MPIGPPLSTDMDHMLMHLFTIWMTLHYDSAYHAAMVGQTANTKYSAKWQINDVHVHPGHVFDICMCVCRPASSDVMDEHMLAMGIPNFVEFMRRKQKSLYFCFITSVEHGPMPTASPAGSSQ